MPFQTHFVQIAHFMEQRGFSPKQDMDHSWDIHGIGGTMAQIVGRIPELQLEYATHPSSGSVRFFLMEIKGFTERQYRHIMSRSAVIEWKAKREEIQNEATVRIAQKHIDQLAWVHEQHIAASKLAVARAVEHLGKQMDTKSHRSSTDILNCINAVRSSQDVFHRAMGIAPADAGLLSLTQNLPRSERQSEEAQPPLLQSLEKLTYEEILVLIDVKRSASKPQGSVYSDPAS